MAGCKWFAQASITEVGIIAIHQDAVVLQGPETDFRASRRIDESVERGRKSSDLEMSEETVHMQVVRPSLKRWHGWPRVLSFFDIP
jgi:hypothetical protein